MKILFTHHRYHTNLHNWFRGFQENGHEVKLLVYKPDEIDQPDLPKSDYLPPSKWSVKKMQKNPRTRGDGVDSFSPYYFPSFVTLYRYFKEVNPDLVIIRPVFTRFGHQILLLALLFRCKIVFHSRIRIHRKYTRVKKIIVKSLLGLFNAYWISPCKGNKDEYSLVSRRLVYFPFLIEPKFEVRKYSQNGKINVLCVAKYFKSKNPKMMLEVFLKLKEEFTNLNLTICGTGDPNGDYYRRMLQIREDSGLEDDIELLINQPLERMSELYSNHDIFVLPTNHDPASFTVLEAMSYGLATITTEVDGSEAYICRGQNGYVFPQNDKVSLTSYLRFMMNEPDRINSFGRKSLLLIKERHHPKQITKEFLTNIYS